MEPGTQPHGGRDSGTAAQDRSETDGTPPLLDPHSTHNLPHPGYTGQSDGMHPDPYASYDFAAFAQNWSLRSATGSYSVEVYDATEGDDEIRGGNGDDVLTGDRDADWLHGGAGHDRLIGGPGDDVLWGGSGHDHLHGGDGADVLDGGPGNDSLIGGDGADVFEFSLPVGWEETVPTFGDDVIYDFNASEGDRLDFSQIYERFPDLSVGVRPTEDGDILITFAHADGTPVGSVTLHRLAYQPIDGFPGPGAPHAPPYEHPDTDPGTPYAPPYDYPDMDPGRPPAPPYEHPDTDPGTPYAPPYERPDMDPGRPPAPPYEHPDTDPGMPYAPPYERPDTDPGTPYALPYERPDMDLGTPYAPPYEIPEDPGHPAHPGIPSISEFLLPYVDIHAEPVEVDAM